MNKRYVYRKLVKHRGNIGFLIVFSILLITASTLLFSTPREQIIVKDVKVSPFLTANGTHLSDRGMPYAFVGFNMYQIASLPGHNNTCGGYIEDIDGFFATLRPNSMIRIWAWQGSMGINPETKEVDFAGIDRVIAAAKKYDQRLIVSLGSQSGVCDDGQWKDSSWYEKGYKEVHKPSGATPLSYWEYVQRIVAHYKDSQTIAMWELINEPETSDCVGYTGVSCYGHQSCPDHTQAARVLRQFFDTVGGKIKSIDPNHLIESGLIGTGQCGSDNDYYKYLHESPAIDVASYHDYDDDDSPLPGDQWNGLAMRLKQMKQINKPLIIGEVGMLAFDGSTTCQTFEERANKLHAKMDAMFSAGVAGFLPWSRSPHHDTNCNYDIGNDDPFLPIINTYQLP